MNEKTFEGDLQAVLDGSPDLNAVNIRTFAEAGLLTRDCGLVMRMVDGTEFQLTIVRSRRHRAASDESDDDDSE